MMGSDFFFRDKIPVVILGATEKIAITLIEKLSHHPWFEVIALCDEHFVGQLYKEAVPESVSFPKSIQHLKLQSSLFPFSCSLVFSCLESDHALAIEKLWVQTGYCVVSSRDVKDDSGVMLRNAESLLKEGNIYW